MRRAWLSLVSVVLAFLAIVSVVQGFTTSEKQTISALKARVAALEAQAATSQANDVAMAADIDTLDANVAALDERLSALETSAAAFTFSGVVVTVSPPCAVGQCWADVAWDVAPCATGQVEWGLTTSYGHLTKKEVGLLCHHKQHIVGLDPDTTYHFRIIATDGTPDGPVAYHVVS